MMKSRLWVTFLFSNLLWISSASAHPEMIRLGYARCTACHTDSFGGGMLTSYGKGISHAESFFSKELEENSEEPTLRHGFRGRVAWLRDQEGSQFFPMQADYLGHVKMPHTRRVNADVVLGVDQKRTDLTKTSNFTDRFLVRKALLRWDINPTTTLAVGRDFLPVGLNIADHSAMIRSQTRRGVTDYVTQVRNTWTFEHWDITPFVYFPSFEEEDNNRESGLGFQMNYLFSESVKFGKNISVGSTPSIFRFSSGMNFSVALSEKFGFLFEYNGTLRDIRAGDGKSFWQHLMFIEPFWFPFTYLKTALTAERMTRAEPFETTLYRYGPSLDLRMNGSLSLLFDIRKTVQPNISLPAETLYFGQLFVHL